MTIIERIVTDMGNGGAYCSNCHYCLDGGDPLVRVPLKCPNCKEEFKEESLYISSGGSDF